VPAIVLGQETGFFWCETKIAVLYVSIYPRRYLPMISKLRLHVNGGIYHILQREGYGEGRSDESNCGGGDNDVCVPAMIAPSNSIKPRPLRRA
jgi:hypothetical protein